MNIAIIGAGIGGLTLAIALRQRGFAPVVYEQAPEIREVGAGLHIQPNGMGILQRLGLADAVSAHGVPIKGYLVCGSDGQVWQHFDFEAHRIVERYGAPSVAIHRGILQSILADEVPTVRTGHRLSTMTQDPSSVHLVFDNGHEVEVDLVVGADGLRSTVRRLEISDPPLRYSGQTCWRVVIPWFLEGLEQFCGVEMWGSRPGVRIGYGHISPADVYVYITQKTEAGQKDDPSRLVEDLHELLSDFPPKIHVMLDAIEPDAVFRNDLFDFPPIQRWWKGRAVVIGDAAHATTPNLGQGACQAIESAYALAESLAVESDVDRSFARYQQSRQNKAWFVTRQSFRLARISNTSGLQGSLFRAMMKRSPLWMFRGQLERAYRLTI